MTHVSQDAANTPPAAAAPVMTYPQNGRPQTWGGATANTADVADQEVRTTPDTYRETQPQAGIQPISSAHAAFTETPHPYQDQWQTPQQPIWEGHAHNPFPLPATPPPFQTSSQHSPSLPYLQSGGSLSQRPKTRLGYTVAGMCFMAATLIMIFVFIMAQNLPATNEQAAASSSTNGPKVIIQPTNTSHRPGITPTTVSVTPTPSVAAAGSYIHNINLASSVNTGTGQPVQTANIFHFGQPVYITMTIQQAAYSGAVCLQWTINQQVIPYAAAAAPTGAAYLTQTNAYFYYKPGGIGPGSVDVYWASTTACANKVFIQHLPFTVVK
ncbi:hypothetical protein [Dictyobacter arantiisoli]|uniref:Uncharacterized protein n=1 Tax=Dictyobacter arantiisoli TaxID=2014874 RepID=A0A5A5TAW0_9CHLR|nr:hypothetical protein [Dictyobacter arantiisoli]GCF08538.1 hypothetical protein KDI_21020 [Dictyobacter arantiisoli]